MKKSIALTVILIVFLLLLSSCAYFREPDIIVGGDRLDDELLSEIRDEIFGTEESYLEEVSEVESEEISEESESSAPETESDSQSDTDVIEKGNEEADPKTVYWSEHGKVWHTDKACGYLKNSNVIHSGTVEEAKNSGKERVCSGCGKK